MIRMRNRAGRAAPLLAPAVLLLLLSFALTDPAVSESTRVTIGSKAFAESWILGEAMAGLARKSGGAEVIHRENLGGTEIVYAALRGGSIDVYPEYTGTIAEVVMKAPGRPSSDEMRRYLAGVGLGLSDPLGFDDSYALAVTAETRRKYDLRSISDLARHPDLRLAFSHEFLGRKDGWPGLSARYGLSMPNVRGIQHDLAYTAIASGEADVIDIYTTDAQIERLNLEVLRDDMGFFPRYDAVLIYRLDLPKRAPDEFASMTRIVGRIGVKEMIRANARVVLDGESPAQAADSLLGDLFGEGSSRSARARPGIAQSIARNTVTHLKLVALSLALAIVVGIPLGVLATRSRSFSAATLSFTGLLQTIPSLALLAFLIPLLGIGPRPALVALFLYSLLPIVRNTYTGLTTIQPELLEAAEAMGLPYRARLLRVHLPMASPAIAAGIKTSAVINVGTATLAALIGAGGLGGPILQGIALRDTGLTLQGAIPAAALALLVQGAFDLLDRLVIPRGLSIRS
jgi:osmoprotectant transport system permease protein